jgi:hypothetical protein
MTWLAFEQGGSPYFGVERPGILRGSFPSGVAGFAALRWSLRKVQTEYAGGQRCGRGGQGSCGCRFGAGMRAGHSGVASAVAMPAPRRRTLANIWP